MSEDLPPNDRVSPLSQTLKFLRQVFPRFKQPRDHENDGVRLLPILGQALFLT